MDQPNRLAAALLRAATLALVVGLSACSSMSGLGGSSEFQCKAPEGIPCQSISGVHYNERAGNLPAQRMGTGGVAAQPKPELRREGGSLEARTDDTVRAQPAAYRKPGGIDVAPDTPAPLGAIRSDPTVIRIWIAPWEDADGDLNDQSYVYLQIDSGRWLIEHNRAQIRREFAPQRPAPVAVAPSPTPEPAARTAAKPLPAPGPQVLSKDEAAAIGRALAQGTGKAAGEAAAAKTLETRP